MLQVKVNDELAEVNYDGISTLSDLIEIIKGCIDPEHIIVDLKLDEKDLSQMDWTVSVSSLANSTLEVWTDTSETFLARQLTRSPEAVQACFVQFRDSRKSFQLGDSIEGNRKLLIATDTLKAFFEWYVTLIQLAPKESQDILDLQTNAADIMGVCNNICNLQLYKSWWALGEMIANELEPRLDALEDKCRRMIRQLNQSSEARSQLVQGT